MPKILKSHAKMKEQVRERVQEILEEARKNPYLKERELDLAIEIAVKEYTRGKIRQSSTKFPVGTPATDKRRQNLREWKLKQKTQKEKK